MGTTFPIYFLFHIKSRRLSIRYLRGAIRTRQYPVSFRAIGCTSPKYRDIKTAKSWIFFVETVDRSFFQSVLGIWILKLLSCSYVTCICVTELHAHEWCSSPIAEIGQAVALARGPRSKGIHGSHIRDPADRRSSLILIAFDLFVRRTSTSIFDLTQERSARIIARIQKCVSKLFLWRLNRIQHFPRLSSRKV